MRRGLLLWLLQDPGTLEVRSPVAAADPDFPDYIASLLGAPVTSGDTFDVLPNGDTIFPAMLAAVEGAQRRISFESFIYSDGAISEQFTQDRTLAGTLERAFDADVDRSQRLELSGWRSRPLWRRAQERFWSLFSELFCPPAVVAALHCGPLSRADACSRQALAARFLFPGAGDGHPPGPCW